MAPEKPLEISMEVRELIAKRGLSEAHIRYIRENNTDGFTAGDAIIWAGPLPSGKRMKVKVKETEDTFLVVYAFTY